MCGFFFLNEIIDVLKRDGIQSRDAFARTRKQNITSSSEIGGTPERMDVNKEKF